MYGFNLKRKIFAPLILSGLVIFAIGFYIIAQYENRQMDNTVHKLAISLRGHIESVVNVRSIAISSSLSFITHDSEIVSALKNKDSDTLLKLGTPIYQRLNKIGNITHLYFHGIDRINLLRVHQPERRGDRIDRITLLAAEKNLAFSSGVELGPLGTFTLRCVVPVFDDSQLVGYIELGQEIDDVIQQSREMFNIETFTLIYKQYLSRADWERGMAMLHRSFDWDQFGGAVLSSQSMDQTPSELLSGVSNTPENQDIRIAQDISLDSRRFWAAEIPLPDAGGRHVATLVVLRDMTAMLAEFKNNLLLFVAIVSAIGLGILLIFYVVLNRTELQLFTAEQNFIAESRAKADMQANFIQQLQAEHAKLTESEERTRLLLESVGEGVFGLDLKGNITFVNPTACHLLGYTLDELIGQPAHQCIHHRHSDGTDYSAEQCPICSTLIDGRSHYLDNDVFWRKDETYFPIEYTCTPIIKTGILRGAVVIFSDITVRKQAQAQIEQSLQIQRVLDSLLNIALPPLSLQEVMSKSLDAVLSIPAFHLLNKGAIFLVAEDGNSLEMVAQRNLPTSLLTSCAKLPFGQCLCGQAAKRREIIFKNHIDEQHQIRYDGMEAHGHYCLPMQSGETLLGVLNIYVTDGHQSDTSERSYLKTVADTMALVIERKKSEESLQQLAHHDNLTGLPNRTLFYQRLEQMIALAHRRNEKFFLLYLDLDHFKEINDNLGHDVGDDVLKETTNRLQACARKSDTVCRMGGDEFTVLLSETMQQEHAALVAQRIIDNLSQPFPLHGIEHQLGCSIGIAEYPKDANDGETLIKHADQAMYLAKTRRNIYCFYQS